MGGHSKSRARLGGGLKILLLSLADKNFADVGAISGPNKQAYADRHGYRFIQKDRLLDPGRHAAWNKILWILTYLSLYDWIFWTDADSLIMNPAVRLEDIIGDTAAKLIIGKEEGGANSGIFLIKNDELSFKFLTRVYDPKNFSDTPWWDNTAIVKVLKEPDFSGSGFVHYVDLRVFNSYASQYTNKLYQEGDFIAHFAGLNREKWNLVGLMKQYAYGIPYKCVDAGGYPMAGRPGCLPDC